MSQREESEFTLPFPDYPCNVANVRTRPVIHPSAYIAPSAALTGAVRVGAESSLWHNVMARGDFNYVEVGNQCNIQDGACLHNTAQAPCIIRDRSSVGHMAIVHGSLIEEECLIGMGAIVMNHVVVGRGSIVGAGALVLDGTIIPPGSLVLGSPAKVRGPLNEEQAKLIPHTWKSYVNYSRAYLKFGVQPYPV
ncbi:MAG: gamma carbonic anhydrase family protein [Planctomycetota bacterium]